MTDLETLNALLDAAGMGSEKKDFQTGVLIWEKSSLNEASEVMARLKALVEDGASGWIMFADDVVEPRDGLWDARWDKVHPLEGELAKQNCSIRLTHANGSWVLATAFDNLLGEGILEDVTHRRLHGGTITHRVCWTDALNQDLTQGESAPGNTPSLSVTPADKFLRPCSAALLKPSRKD